MTQTTDPGTPPQRGARRTQLIIALIGVVALALTGGIGFLVWPRPPASGPSAELPSRFAPWFESARTSGPNDGLWSAMSQAMRDKDRDAFLSVASGEAVAQLALWWDNTTAIGWDIATVSSSDEVDDAGRIPVLVSVGFPFAAHMARGSGNADAGLQLLQGYRYLVTLGPETSSDDENRTIVSFTPENAPNAWDEGPIHVVKREHSILFGMSEEADLVESTADVAEESAVLALDHLRSMGGQPAQQGFVSGVTADAERFGRWRHGKKDDPWAMDVAGFARQTLRPTLAAPWIDPTIATGIESSGTLVVLGPLSADQRKSTFVHEFAHALHYTAVPGSLIEPPLSVVEGFARYFEWSSGVSERGYLDPRVKELVATKGDGAFSDTALREKGASLAYDAAGSYYAFVAATGGSPWELAISAKQKTLTGLIGAAGTANDFSIGAWQAWVAAQ